VCGEGTEKATQIQALTIRLVGRSLNSCARKKPKPQSFVSNYDEARVGAVDSIGMRTNVLGASMTTDPDRHASLFIGNACQYYATARFAMHAQCIPVCGNLFHHAVEMLVKGGLARTRKLSDLKNMGHKLKLLWRAFKADFPDTSLKRHDRTISLLDKF